MMFRIALAAFLFTASGFAQEGSQVFISRCMQCHSPFSVSHAPPQEALAQISWQEILKTLESGAMQVQAQSLSPEERMAVSRYLGKEAGSQVLRVRYRRRQNRLGLRREPGVSHDEWN